LFDKFLKRKVLEKKKKKKKKKKKNGKERNSPLSLLPRQTFRFSRSASPLRAPTAAGELDLNHFLALASASSPSSSPSLNPCQTFKHLFTKILFIGVRVQIFKIHFRKVLLFCRGSLAYFLTFAGL
jgi:hypothetical protein